MTRSLNVLCPFDTASVSFAFIIIITANLGISLKMETYLRECKEKLQKLADDEAITVVLGNEACDLDSAVSSLVLAYFLNESSQNKGLIIPVLNVKRKYLKLRSEVAFFLEETSVNLDDLICKDEIDIKKFAEQKHLKVVLVDHNILSDEDAYLQPFVIQVVDHHVVEKRERLRNCDTVIEQVGSCCTLVAEKILSAEPPLTDPQIAMLLYGTVLLDTVCLSEEAKRTTEKDKVMVHKLESILEGISREEVFQALQKAKFDVSGFSPQELLYKDLKIASSDSSSVAISSIPALLENFINGGATESALSKFSEDNQCKAVILLGSHVSKDGKSIRRQIAVFSTDSTFLKDLCGHLKNLKDPSLELEALNPTSPNTVLFEQKNVALTRKFVMPAVRDFLHQPEVQVQEVSGSGDISTLSDELNSLDMREDLIRGYHAETLDVPDSPSHISLLELTGKENGEERIVNSFFESPPTDRLRTSTVNTESELISSVRKKISVHPSDLQSDHVNDDQKSLSSLSNKSDGDVFSPTEDGGVHDDDVDEDMDTPDELDNSDVSVGYMSPTSERIAEISAAEELEEERSWKTCIINDEERKIDMRVIEPYKKVLSHGGYHGDTRNAIIIFSACYLPNRSRKDYDYVMDNLFLYVLSTLDQLVAESYVLVYLHGATERGSMPSFGWLKRCYLMIDRRLRKNLKQLYLVHPTFWLKTIVIMTRPFISSKFSRKLKFVYSLSELSSLIPMNDVCIPEKVKILDSDLMGRNKRKR